MRSNFLVVALLLLPFLSAAQPEKVRVGTTQEEFLRMCPDAERDWEMEATEISESVLIGKIAGRDRWTYYNDTIQRYWFKSEPVYGPSKEFPKPDSTQIHNMKVELDKVRAEFEAALGSPRFIRNYPLNTVGPETKQNCYLAVWVYPGNRVVSLMIRNDDTPKSLYNAPANSKDKTSGIYTMEILIDSREKFVKEKYGVGLSLREFQAKFPRLSKQITFESLPTYVIPDTAVCDNAEWGFEFEDGEMYNYIYVADYGTSYGAASDEAAYDKLKQKSEQLVRDMNMLYGFPDSISNVIKPAYVIHDRKVSYDYVWFYARWETEVGPIELVFSEMGGGKNPAAVFSITLEWIE